MQEQESSTNETPVCDEGDRAEPVNVPDATKNVRPDRETEADNKAGGNGEHDRDGTTTSNTVTFDVLKVLAVHGGGEDGDGQLDSEFSSFADSRGIAPFMRGERGCEPAGWS